MLAESHAESLTIPRKCSTGAPELSTHLKQMESSSVVAVSVDSSARMGKNEVSFRDLRMPCLIHKLMASRYSLIAT